VNTSDGKLKRLPDMPVPRVDAGAASYQSDVYIVGGTKVSTGIDPYSNLVQRFRTTDSSWYAVPAKMPTSRFGVSAAVWNGILFAIGGTTSGNGMTVNEGYNIASGKWATYKASDFPHAGAGCVAWNDWIYMIGGGNDLARNMQGLNIGAGSKCEVYYAPANFWSPLPDLPVNLVCASAAVLDKTLYVAGGYSNNIGYCPAFKMVVGTDKPGDSEWTEIASPLNGALVFFQMIAIGGKLYAFGGMSRFYSTGAIFVYDPEANLWSQLPPHLGRGRSFMAAATLGATGYLFGGTETLSSEALPTGESITPSSLTLNLYRKT